MTCALLPGPDCSPLVLPAPAAEKPAPPAPEVAVPWYVSRLPPPGFGIFIMIILTLYALQITHAK